MSIMLAIISPAKSLDMSNISKDIPATKPIFEDKTTELLKICQKYSQLDLQKIMHISDKLAELNYQRYQNFNKQAEKQAIFAFNGDVYSKIDKTAYDTSKLNFAQEHLIILSGLYGALRPLDKIRAHRLEMGTIVNDEILSKYWQVSVTKSLNNDLNTHNNPILINLASNEYLATVDSKKLGYPIINISFKENRSGKLTTIALNAKRARGMMVDFIIKNSIDASNDLKAFKQEDYQFNPELSDDNTFSFTR